MMTRRAFAVQGLLCAVLIVAINVAIARLTVNAVPRQVLRAIAASPQVGTLFVGNSLVVAGIDAMAYEQAGGAAPALNVGLGSSTPIEHDVLLRQALPLRPRRVVYGFFDAQLTQSPGVSWTDLFGNRAAAFYIQPDVSARFIAPESPWRRLQFRLLGHVPMFVERAAIWANVERRRRRLRDIGVPAQATGRFGQIADFADLQPLSPEEFRRYCARAVAGRAPLIDPIVDMLAETRRQGVTMLVVEMPQAVRHRARYHATPDWEEYRRYVTQEIQRLGGTYLRASDWMPEDAFEDGMHLSPAGARTFSARLATGNR